MNTFFHVVGIIACVIVLAVVVFTTFFGDIHVNIDVKNNDEQGNK